MIATATPTSSIALRALTQKDLKDVVAIDAAIERHTRRPYFDRRVAAAVREPTLHVQLAAESDGEFAGFILARLLEGEFGYRRPALRLEVIGVHGNMQGRGIGGALLDALIAWGRRHDVDEIQTQAAWNDHGMLRWLDRQRFRLAPTHIVDCAVDEASHAPPGEERASVVRDDGGEISYVAQSDDAYERLARDLADVRSMRHEDLADIVRIDRHITGRDRAEYMRHKLAEAMEDSAVRVSLTARVDDAVIGYVMASVDFGDYGRAEPVAVLDTIGVDPAYAHRGVGRALISQLCANLAALHIERVETVVAPHDLELLAFLYDAGFAPSQRVPFVLRIRA